MWSWPHGLAKCDENKHDEVTFQLAAVDVNSCDPKYLWQIS